jgi:hypothetical protein
LQPRPEVRVFTGGNWEAFVEPSDPLERSSLEAEIAGIERAPNAWLRAFYHVGEVELHGFFLEPLHESGDGEAGQPREVAHHAVVVALRLVVTEMRLDQCVARYDVVIEKDQQRCPRDRDSSIARSGRAEVSGLGDPPQIAEPLTEPLKYRFDRRAAGVVNDAYFK